MTPFARLRRSPFGLLWGAAFFVCGGLWVAGIAGVPLAVHETARSVVLYTRPAGEIAGSQTVGQTFVAPQAGLYKIEILLDDYGRQNSGEVRFQLKTSPAAEAVLRSGSFRAETVREETVQAVEFAPLPDSAGQTYYFELSAPDAAPGQAVTALVRPQFAYAAGDAYRNGVPFDGDLTFSAYFRVPVWERAGLLLDQLADGRPGLWGDPRFYLVLLGLYGLLVGGLVWQLARWLTPPP